MDRPKLEVADIFRRYGEAYREKHGASMSTAQRRVMTAIEICRTAALGGQIEKCDACGQQRICYRSCRNRHCDKCQSLARAEWIEHRQAELLNCEYYHVVFTVPDKIAAIAYQNKEVIYNILFRPTSETLRTIPNAPYHLASRIGFFAVLQRWDRVAHRICVRVLAAASRRRRWFLAPGFFLPVRVLSLLFRRYLGASQAAPTRANWDSSPLELRDREFACYLGSVSKVKWVVYAKRPFAGPEQVLDYVGRYTHRIAISNNRLLDIEGGQVNFRYKDYRNSDQQRTMTLAAEEFIRRFLLHVLPRGFHRIRYYGFLGNRFRQEKLARCRELLSMTLPQVTPKQSANSDYHERHEELTGTSLRMCPVCHHGHMVVVELLKPLRTPAIKDTS